MPPRRKVAALPNPPGRALLYVRVSALMGRSGDDFHSPEIQIDAMRQMAEQAGLREVAVIDDDLDKSGRTFVRKGIARIRSLVEAGEVDVVAVYALSRIGRNLSESLEFVKWLRKHGVSVMSTQEKIDDTPEGQFMVGMWLNLAELQSAQIGVGWARIIERRAHQGMTHGPIPSGYTRVNGRLDIDPILGPGMSAAFAEYAVGERIADIARRYALVRGRPIAKNQLKKMLRNPLYVGTVVLNSRLGGRVEVPGLHPPLVKRAVWDKVQRRMAKDRTTPARYLSPRHSLTGLLRCADCEGPLQTTYSYEHGRDRPTRRLFCPRKREPADCDGIGIPPYAGIEQSVLQMVALYAERLRGDLTAHKAQQQKASNAALNAIVLERELAKTRAAMTRLTERWARRAMSDRNYDTAMAVLGETEASQVDALDSARDESAAPDTGAIVALVDRMLKLWPRMSAAEQNGALKSVLRQASVRRAAFWREPEVDRVIDPIFHW